MLYLSRYIIRNRADYYRLLLSVTRDSAWEAWLLYMLRGVHEIATWTTDKINAIHALMAHTTEHVRARAPRIYNRELVELVFVQPCCRIQNIVDAGRGHRQTASVYLKALVDIGVLREQKVGREKLFIHPKYMQLLTGDSHEFSRYDNAVAAPSGKAPVKPKTRKAATKKRKTA